MDKTNQIRKQKKKRKNPLGVENERMSEMISKSNEGTNCFSKNMQAYMKEGDIHQTDKTKEPISEGTDRSEQVMNSHRFPLHSDVSTPKSEFYEMELQNRTYENNRNAYHLLSTPFSSEIEKKGTKNTLLQSVGSLKGTVLNNMNGDTLSSYTIYQGGGEENALKNSTGISENNSISNCSFHGGIISNDLLNGEFLKQGEIPNRHDDGRIGGYQNGLAGSNLSYYHVKKGQLSSMHPQFYSNVKRSLVCTHTQGGDKSQRNGDAAQNSEPVNKEQLAKQISRNLVDAKNGFNTSNLVTQQGKNNTNQSNNNMCNQEWHVTNGNSFIKRSDVNDYQRLRGAQCSTTMNYTIGANNVFNQNPRNASPQGVNFYISNTHGRSVTPGGYSPWRNSPRSDSPGSDSPVRSAPLLKNATTYSLPRGNYHLYRELSSPNCSRLSYVSSQGINTTPQWDNGKRTMEHAQQHNPSHGGAHQSNNKVKNARLNDGNIGLQWKKNHKVFVKNTLLSDDHNSRKNCVVESTLGRSSPSRHNNNKNRNNVLKFVIPVGSLKRGRSLTGGINPSYRDTNEEKEKKKKKNCKPGGDKQITISAASKAHEGGRGNDGNGQMVQPVYVSQEGGETTWGGLNDARGGSIQYVLSGKSRQSVQSSRFGQSDCVPPSARKPPNRGYYAKKGNLTYSGLLTSMVSSILTQQNERQSQEGNCFSYACRGSGYNYALLRPMEDGMGGEKKQQDENKGESDYQFSSKIIQQLRSKATNEDILQLTLILMICISVLCNYDHGAIPVTLEEIQKDFPLSYIEQSLLGSLVYFGLIIGTIIASVLFELLTAKLLITISTLLLSMSLYIFSHANCVTFMYISRFINGLCQAIPVVYLPVWVDEFSPHEKATQWMSYIQLASIGGTVFGYFLGGVLSNSSYSYGRNNAPPSNATFVTTWRSPFLIQAFLLLPLFLIMLFIPSDMINISSGGSVPSEGDEEELSDGEMHGRGGNGEGYVTNEGHIDDTHEEQSGQAKGHPLIPEPTTYTLDRSKSRSTSRLYYGASSNSLRRNFNRSATYIMEKKTNILRKTLKEVKKLLNNKLYIIITLGMSNLYFVVTGIQFWITEYMSVVLLTEKMKIVTVSTLCFLTSPTSGVWFGGFVCDLFGGYKNTNYSRTIKVATAFAISACIFGILSAHLNNFVFFSISLWLCLFTGSALVPVAVGMLLSCVNNHQKSLSSAVSQVIYNVFGWFSAPLLSGIIMDIMHKYTNDNRLALKAGFTMILYSSFIGFLLLFYANFLDFSDRKDNDETLELEEPLA
ncbi:hypothetical protein C922_01595 [Plasmodium inui San Antonio 1]|uniref:Major facilitator superfamily (MFS) profile domain-containing protein n=1 Tax=Plasmodium inui San Antonio 1 TaxID=1237626 RepID=W7A9M1_9APIC|nr:hypothetical protein C922_01595 [Plasmodium inui San Antonio 1]EUD67983.1 hypothetical protein C922_01595 [Plasmodium inui San Antonio 1]